MAWWLLGLDTLFASGKSDEEKHIESCHLIMDEAIQYLDRPVLGKNAKRLAERMRKLVNEGRINL